MKMVLKISFKKNAIEKIFIKNKLSIFFLGVVLFSGLTVYCNDFGSIIKDSSSTDTIINFYCKCGLKKDDTASIGSVPVIIQGYKYYKTYFRSSDFIPLYYDYLVTIHDTIFIVSGKTVPSLPGFSTHRHVLCVLADKHKEYKREIEIQNNLPIYFIFKDKIFDNSVHKNIYRYRLATKSVQGLADIPTLKEIGFTKDGRIFSYVIDKVNCVCNCQRK